MGRCNTRPKSLARAEIAKSRSRVSIQTEHHPGRGLVEYSRAKRFSMGKCRRIN